MARRGRLADSRPAVLAVLFVLLCITGPVASRHHRMLLKSHSTKAHQKQQAQQGQQGKDDAEFLPLLALLAGSSLVKAVAKHKMELQPQQSTVTYSQPTTTTTSVTYSKPSTGTSVQASSGDDSTTVNVHAVDSTATLAQQDASMTALPSDDSGTTQVTVIAATPADNIDTTTAATQQAPVVTEDEDTTMIYVIPAGMHGAVLTASGGITMGPSDAAANTATESTASTVSTDAAAAIVSYNAADTPPAATDADMAAKIDGDVVIDWDDGTEDSADTADSTDTAGADGNAGVAVDAADGAATADSTYGAAAAAVAGADGQAAEMQPMDTDGDDSPDAGGDSPDDVATDNDDALDVTVDDDALDVTDDDDALDVTVDATYEVPEPEVDNDVDGDEVIVETSGSDDSEFADDDDLMLAGGNSPLQPSFAKGTAATSMRASASSARTRMEAASAVAGPEPIPTQPLPDPLPAVASTGAADPLPGPKNDVPAIMPLTEGKKKVQGGAARKQNT